MTLPSTLALEKLTNPFLRTTETSVKQKADERNGQRNGTPSEVFCGLESLERQVLRTPSADTKILNG
ncbi:protein of unknown function [Pseudomonas mediterranea]